jgi:hypothetical protein
MRCIAFVRNKSEIFFCKSVYSVVFTGAYTTANLVVLFTCSNKCQLEHPLSQHCFYSTEWQRALNLQRAIHVEILDKSFV